MIRPREQPVRVITIYLVSNHPPFVQGVDCQLFWIAVRTFYAQEAKVSHYLEDLHVRHFIPSITRRVEEKNGKVVRRQQPVVHNLLFIPLEQDCDELKEILSKCPYSIYVYRHSDHQDEWCLISDNDMTDLRLMCDSEFNEPIFMSSLECEMKMGTVVRVVHGPMKGFRGKLIRKNKKYYIMKVFDGFGVAVKVSRWCCVPEPEKVIEKKLK